MAVYTSTIGGTDYDFATVASWEADATEAGRPGSGDIAQGLMRDYADTGDIVILGASPTASAYRELTYDGTGAYHYGVEGAGARFANTVVSTDILDIQESYFRLTGIELDGGDSGSALGNGDFGIQITESIVGVLIRRCIIHSFNRGAVMSGICLDDGTSGLSGASVTVENCFLWDISEYGVGIDSPNQSGVTLNVYYCTGYNCGGGISPQTGDEGGLVAGFGTSAGDLTINNYGNLMAGNGGASFNKCGNSAAKVSATEHYGDYCASDDATAGTPPNYGVTVACFESGEGGNNATSITLVAGTPSAGQYAVTNLTSGSEDLRAVDNANNEILDFCAYSAVLSEDVGIRLTDRPTSGTVDLGADQVTAVAAGERHRSRLWTHINRPPPEPSKTHRGVI